MKLIIAAFAVCLTAYAQFGIQSVPTLPMNVQILSVPPLTKGKQVYVEGRLQTRNYDDKDGKKQYVTEVVAEDVILLGGRGGEGMDDQGGGRAAPVSMPRSAPRPAAAAEPMEITDDDVPF